MFAIEIESERKIADRHIGFGTNWPYFLENRKITKYFNLDFLSLTLYGL